MALAHILAWLVAICADLGKAAETASPITWTLDTSFDSYVRKSTSHQRLSILLSRAICAGLPARCGGIMLSTSALTESNSVFTVRLAISTSITVLLGL